MYVFDIVFIRKSYLAIMLCVVLNRALYTLFEPLNIQHHIPKMSAKI